MSLKGHVFTHEDLPRLTRQRLKNKQQDPAPIDAYLERQTERFKIVAMDDDVPIIAEELDERLMRAAARNDAGEIDGAVLVQLRNLMQLSVEQRCQVLNAIDMDGHLANTFAPPPEPEKPAKKAKK